MRLELLLRRVPVGRRTAIIGALLVLPMTALIITSVVVLEREDLDLQDSLQEAVSALVPLSTLEYDLQRALTDELESNTSESAPDFAHLTSSIDRAFTELRSDTGDKDLPPALVDSAQRAWADVRPAIRQLVERVKPLRLDPAAPSATTVRAELSRAIQDVEAARVRLAKAVHARYIETAAAQHRQLRLLLWAWTITMFVAALCVATLVTSILRPVRELGQAALRLGRGEFSVRVDNRGRDELGAVASSFNAMAARLETSHRLLQTEAQQDPLTHLPNRRAIMGALDSALSLGEAQGKPVSVLMIDADNFKLINDRFGHPAGDEALLWLAERMRGALRGDDLLGRYAGDEFLAVLPNTTSAQAAQVADRVCRAVNEVAQQDKRRVGVTVGVATLRPDGESGATLLEAADRALYQAKAAGRGRYALVHDAARKD